MQTKPQVWKIARTVAGLCVGAGLIYFLFSEKSPPIVIGLILLAVWVFVRQQRKAGLYDQSPTFRRLALVGSRKPLRDFGLAVACLVGTLAVTLGIVAGVDHKVLSDNKVTWGILIVAIFAGIAGVMWFMSGIIGRSHLWAAAVDVRDMELSLGLAQMGKVGRDNWRSFILAWAFPILFYLSFVAESLLGPICSRYAMWIEVGLVGVLVVAGMVGVAPYRRRRVSMGQTFFWILLMPLIVFFLLALLPFRFPITITEIPTG